MANKFILIITKVVLSIVVLALMAAAHVFGVPIIIKNLIGLTAIGGIWAYKPSSQNDQNTTNP